MDMMHIYPNSHLEAADPRKVMVISSQAKSKEFQRWWTNYVEPNRSEYTVYLDPPVFEGDDYDVNEYLAVARDLHPEYMTVPDARFNAELTTFLFKRWSAQCSHIARKGVLAVAQGKTPEQWIQCAKWLVGTQVPMLLAVVEETDMWVDTKMLGRLEWLTYMKHEAPELFGVKLHLFGLSEAATELWFIRMTYRNWVVSCDTGKGVVWTAADRSLPEVPIPTLVPPYPGRKALATDFFSLPLPRDAAYAELLKYNLSVLNAWAAGNWIQGGYSV